MRVLMIAALVAGTAVPVPVQAASKKENDCGFQANVVFAVQQARIARVNERKVAETVEASAKWPEKYNAVIPLVTPWVYEMKMRDVKKQDLSAAWKEMCLAQ